MTPEAQRIALAKWDGWVTDCGYTDSLKENVFYGSCPSRGITWEQCPDYLNDLNAVHELEERLTEEQRASDAYAARIADVTGYDDMLWPFIHATAPQRCEALLRTLGLWEEQ